MFRLRGSCLPARCGGRGVDCPGGRGPACGASDGAERHAVNREAAGKRSLVNPGVPGEVVAALENALCDESWRQTMRQRERRRAELFSEYAVAERLMQIYTSL